VILNIKYEIVAEYNALQRFSILNMCDVSSTEKRTPPIGAPKVIVIPTARAAESI
jgi:hypothetical protein